MCGGVGLGGVGCGCIFIVAGSYRFPIPLILDLAPGDLLPKFKFDMEAYSNNIGAFLKKLGT